MASFSARPPASASRTTEIDGARRRARAITNGIVLMRYTLREGLYHCLAGPNVIFLDVSRNRYFALPAPCEEAFRRLVAQQGESFPEVSDGLSTLIAAGHLVEKPSPGRCFHDIKIGPPRADFAGRRKPAFHFFDVLLAMYWEAITSFRLRILPLSAVLDQANRSGRGKAPSQDRIEGLILSMLWAFDCTAFAFGRANRCLARSLAMFSLCRSKGLEVQLVIGVRSPPFAAHAWVQYDDTVLNDTLEQTQYYSPIMVVG